MTARAVESVVSPLLSAPSISGEAARLLLAFGVAALIVLMTIETRRESRERKRKEQS